MDNQALGVLAIITVLVLLFVAAFISLLVEFVRSFFE